MDAVAPQFDNSYAALPERFFSRQQAERFPSPQTVRANAALAADLNLDPDWLRSERGARFAVGSALPAGADPIATVYAGHQFGGWVPRLGDGRALLLGEIIARDGSRYDLQLKGSGRTPYSRGGDGRAPLGPVLREYIVSEAMHALGVPTTRSLMAATTGETVLREEHLPGGVLVRVASSHIRIGTFEYFANRGDTEALQLLVEQVINRHHPEARDVDNPALGVLRSTIAKQARLIARWQLIGFIHGVMNTDNMLLSGETIDYGPCAFMDEFDPATVFSSIDQGGRYAYANQPRIAHWNLMCLARALLPLIGDNKAATDEVQASLDDFIPQFAAAYAEGLADKLGFPVQEEDEQLLARDLFQLMQDHQCDLTLTFRRLTDLAAPQTVQHVPVADAGAGADLPEAFTPWIERWRRRLQQDDSDREQRWLRMRRANPVFIPRNHRVEAVIRAAEDHADFEPFHQLVGVLAAPFTYRPEHADDALPAAPDQRVTATFCGT